MATKIPVPIVFVIPDVRNHVSASLGRLPQQFRSGTVNYAEIPVTTETTSELDAPLDAPLG